MDRYQEILDYLYTRLPMYERSGPPAYKNSLENTIELDKHFGHPHTKFKTIHVAGTNGKGSVSHMLAAILQKAGYKTGLYTSPHLKDFRERIRINSQMISRKFITDWVENFKQKNDSWHLSPSFFELTVAMTFDYFSQQNVDIAVIEVGLGGRLDSTNIINPEVSVITNISLDHTVFLGDTVEKIAAEKAGIIKSGIPVVIGQTQEKVASVFISKANEKKSEIYFADQEYHIDYSLKTLDGKQLFNVYKNKGIIYPELKADLGGTYQIKNLPTVLKTIELLKKKGWDISDKQMYDGLENTIKLTGLNGRWQTIGNNPLIICDTGHNEEGIKEVITQIKNTAYKKLHFIFGTVSDKDPSNILTLLPKDATYYFTKANIPRALNEKILLNDAKKYGLKGIAFSTVNEAFAKARELAEKEDLIFVGGSTFVVAEIL